MERQLGDSHLNDFLKEVKRRITVITPYRAQQHFLQSILPPDVEVLTIDGAQGQEKDFVIVSYVRSGNQIGFLRDMRRLNVALTRAKCALYIIGNLTKIAENDPVWMELLTDATQRKIISHLLDDLDVSSLPVQ
ncbi:unnamed protein product [Rotaria sp. Silwood2]|nr:unnamed protein product [Rotaria sp. Silwood2]